MALRDRAYNPLTYLETGSGNVPVLLVHGNFAGKLWWRELLGNPLPGTRLLAPDLPGFGESPGGHPFAPSIPSYARALARFLDALSIDRAILVGHSFGAAVATQLALSDPGRFPGMFLISPVPPTGLDTPGYLYPILKSYRYDRLGLRRALRQTMRMRIPPYLDDLVDEARSMHPTTFSGTPACSRSGPSLAGSTAIGATSSLPLEIATTSSLHPPRRRPPEPSLSAPTPTSALSVTVPR